MSINIYIEETGKNLDGLCDDTWNLSSQIDALETWLDEDAIGGGRVLNSDSMKVMGIIGMGVYFSEYPTSEQKIEAQG